MAFHVTIESFDGPLDLMLHLIKDKKLDLFDLDMSVLTEQYLAYLTTMEYMKLEIASEFLSELASLIEYKSRKLLPKDETELDGEYEEDPKEKLIRRLIEYQKFKDVCVVFDAMQAERSMHFTKPQSEIPTEWIADDGEIVNLNVYDLLKSIQKMYSRVALLQPLQQKYTTKEISVDDRIASIRHYLSLQAENRFSLLDMLKTAINKEDYVTIFLALLDMARNAELHFIMQSDEDIIIMKGEFHYEESLA